ncbi:MAG: PilX N-terminal domain-containing pilus assembly protein [Sulfuritalea sp.]|jgi:type II secretory pathway pseudopilin PulG|nr:PilX N-terminal domain-containing pilus assembly protein [Sulfuritalea sp.]MDP1985359.1 PilX N-terminal domain-containing pilus assembly protein [Sulfuritalea sp.]
MSRQPSRQRGIVLILSLIMLMVLTLIAVSAIRLSTVNLRTVANAQARSEAMSTAQHTIDLVLSSNFTDTIAGTAQTLTVTEGGKNYTVVVARPCLVRTVPVKNIDLNIALDDDKKCLDTLSNPYSACADTIWQLQATSSSGWFGANVSITQGTGIRMDNGAVTVYANDAAYRCTGT